MKRPKTSEDSNPETLPASTAPPPSAERAVDREFRLGARLIVYVVAWLSAAFILFRLLVPMTWGAPWAIAPLAAIVVAVSGTLALLYLLFVMVRDVRKRI